MEGHDRTTATPTVSRICGETIVELVFDRDKRQTALAISKDGKWSKAETFETPDGERLVPYAPSNNLLAHDCVLLPSAPEPAGSKAELLADIEAYIRRYVDFSPLFTRIAAHYVLLSWVFDAFNEIPILRIQGPYGSGKTRALIVLGSIAYKGFFSSGASTVSPIFHTLDRFGGTLVLDEADLRFSDKTVDLVKILNNGTVRGLPVLRTLQNRNKEFNPAAFTVFGPKIVAMRGAFNDQALESRCLTERMDVRPLPADIPIQLPKSLQAEALSLRNRLLGFRLENLFNVDIEASRVVQHIDPRLNQMALPLLSLMDDPFLRDDVAAMLRDRQAALSAEREESPEARVLAALASFGAARAENIPLQDVAARTNADSLEAYLSPRDVGRILRGLSIPLHKSHGSVVVSKKAA